MPAKRQARDAIHQPQKNFVVWHDLPLAGRSPIERCVLCGWLHESLGHVAVARTPPLGESVDIAIHQFQRLGLVHDRES